MGEKIKFGVGTKVNANGYKGIVTAVRGEDQRHVKLEGGEIVIGIEDIREVNE